MTQAQLERNRKAGRASGAACLAKHGREYFVELGRKGGSRPKCIVYQAPQEKVIKGGRPRSYSELLEALSRKGNLREGGLLIKRHGVRSIGN